MKKKCNFFIDTVPYSFDVEGDFFWGNDKLLFNEEHSVISKAKWKDEGFTVMKIFDDDEFLKLRQSIRNNIINAIQANGILLNEKTFELSDYHRVIKTNELHNSVINITRNLQNKDLDFDINHIVKKIGDILGYKLTSWIEELQKSHIQIRISRPNSLDINPPHRDGYLSYYNNIINIWIPIEGCNELSSLPVFPKSHLITENKILRTESRGAKINGNLYYVPCILETDNGSMKMVRPNPKEGEAIVFTPYLIHGAAINGNKDTTRISIELRFPRLE